MYIDKPSVTKIEAVDRVNPQRTKVFFVTLRTRGRGHFDPHVNSETKEATTMKLCTVIAYYNTSITKELKFLNSHCSIVCGYCSVLRLMAKSNLKTDQIFKLFQSNRNSHIL